jgi:glycosyltransferase involved in cell wall biosynthesis
MIPLPTAHVYQPRSGSILYSEKRHAASYECPLMANFKRATSILNRARQAWIANERKLSRTPDGPVVAALSNYVAEQFKTEYGLHENRIHLVRNGVRIDSFRSNETKEQGRRLRQLFDKKNNLAIFLFAADDPRRKGLSWLLKAAAQTATMLTKNERDFRIIVIGGKKIIPYRKQVRATTIEKRILFLGSTQQMPPLIQMCDAVVLPTYDDPCSRLIMEGLASGKPAITTSYNGAAEFLAAGKYGIIIENCPDTAALAHALLRLCDPQQQKKMSQAIESDHLYQQVSMQRHAQELLTLYKKLLQKKS